MTTIVLEFLDIFPSSVSIDGKIYLSFQMLDIATYYYNFLLKVSGITMILLKNFVAL